MDCLARSRVRLQLGQSLLGSFNFSYRIIPMGSFFCQKLKRARAGVVSPHHTVRLSREIKYDLQVWLEFLRDFNSELLWPCAPASNIQLQLYTDTAGSTGFGEFFQGDWCIRAWPSDWVVRGLTSNLLLLELFPIIVAAMLWSSRLSTLSIVFGVTTWGWCRP